MEGNKRRVHQGGGEHRLENAHRDGLTAHGFQLGHPELIADGEGDEAQGRLGDDIQPGHRLRRGEADAGYVQRPQQVGAKQQAADQIGGDGGEVEQLRQAGHEQSAHQRQGELNQDFHSGTSKLC